MFHLVKIKDNPRDFGDGASDQASEIRPFFMSSSTLITIVFQVDVMDQFAKQSLIFQDRDQSIIGKTLKYSHSFH